MKRRNRTCFPVRYWIESSKLPKILLRRSVVGYRGIFKFVIEAEADALTLNRNCSNPTIYFSKHAFVFILRVFPLTAVLTIFRMCS